MPIHVTGTLKFPQDQLPRFRAAFEEHARLSRLEPGCQRFDYTESRPGVISLNELFDDRTAFDAHVARTSDSDWNALRGDIEADIETAEVS